MRAPPISPSFIVGLLCFAAQVAADIAEPAALDRVPQCAITCLDKLLEPPLSSTRNIERLCSSKRLNNLVTGCLRKTCTIRESLDFLKMEQSICGRPDLDNDHNIRAINYLILGIAVTSVTLRIVSRFVKYIRWGVDDYLIIAGLVFTVVQCILMIALTYGGLGRNMWTLDDHAIVRFSVGLIIVEYSYVLSLVLIKLSILWFFLRTFPEERFQKVVKWTIGFTIISAACICVAGACQGWPTDPTKERWRDESKGSRVNIHAAALSHAGINVVLDIWMFILPLTQLYHIGLKTRKKIGVMLIFSVGIFLVAVSCLRIPFMIDFSRSLNSTADSQGIIVWSNLECGVGILVACLPHTQPLLRAAMTRARSTKLWSKYFGKSEGIFIERDLATIHVTNFDGSTVVGSDDLVLNDQGGLLTIDSSTALKDNPKPSIESVSGRH